MHHSPRGVGVSPVLEKEPSADPRCRSADPSFPKNPHKIWDATIVGAGPAGAMAAALLADRGWKVLLLERSRWPRDKVCGGCINSAAIALLHEANLSAVLRGAHPLRHFDLSIRKSKMRLPLPEGAAIPRDILDQRLVAEAVARGAIFSSETTAALLPAGGDDFRELHVTSPTTNEPLRTRLVLAADGVAGTLLQHEPWARWHIAKNAHFGVATTIQTPAHWTPAHTIAMHVGDSGYVGVAPYGDGRTHLAAALDPLACKRNGGPLLTVQNILAACGIDLPDQLATAKFHGTSLLTRHRKTLGHHRVLALGDACAYVEPFTGEGISWALQSARELTAILPDSLRTWPPALSAKWTRHHAETLAVRQRFCHLLRRTVRYPRLAQAGIIAGNLFPALGTVLVQSVGRPAVSRARLAVGVSE